MSIQDNGAIVQDIQVYRCSSAEKYKFSLSTEQLTELRRLISTIDFAAVSSAAKQSVIDDAEQITVTVFGKLKSRSFSAPLQWWQWQHNKSKGPALAPDVVNALTLWTFIESLSKYRGHCVTNP